MSVRVSSRVAVSFLHPDSRSPLLLDSANAVTVIRTKEFHATANFPPTNNCRNTQVDG